MKLINFIALILRKIFNLNSDINQLTYIRQEISCFENVNKKPTKTKSLKYFFSMFAHALKVTFFERKILIFALLQWVAIAIAYYTWVEMLRWIPEEVWKSASESDTVGYPDVILLLWSFLCTGLASFPVGIFSACTGLLHFLYKQKRSISIARCIEIIKPNIFNIWVFSWIDNWITVCQIVERLPKKDYYQTPQEKALSELLYYTWKLGTMGMLPNLILGNNIKNSAKASVEFIGNKVQECAKLRIGYSILNWIVGISAYVGTIVFFIIFNDLVPFDEAHHKNIYIFYFWAGVPILVAVGIVQLFLRPFYIISLCDIYSDFVSENHIQEKLSSQPKKEINAFVSFLILVLIIVTIFLYRDELGISELLSIPYTKLK